MAQFLVLENFLNVNVGGQLWRFQSGQVVDDTVDFDTTQHTALIAAGLADVPYIAGSMAAVVTAFLAAHQRDQYRPSILPFLIQAGALPGSILSGAGDPNGATTGSYGQIYEDTTGGVFYVCQSDPTGTSWALMGGSGAGEDWRAPILDAIQNVDGAAGGIAPAILLSITGQPTATDTLVITDGTTVETYTFVAAAGAPFEVTIGGTVAITMTNLVATIVADSVQWGAVETAHLDAYFATTPAVQVVIANDDANDTATELSRVYATLTGAGAIQVVEFATAGRYSYDDEAATEAAIPVADPAARRFGYGRAVADLVDGETHNALEQHAGYSWESDGQQWNRTIIIGATLAELASAVAGVEGASLIGTDAKANLGAAATVEAALTYLDTADSATAAELADTGAGTEGAALVGTDAKNALGGATTVEAALEYLDDGIYDPGCVSCITLHQGGQPNVNDLLTIGADVYEAGGVGANINFAIGGGAGATLTNLVAAAVANGTENLLWDDPGGGTTHVRIRSADAPNGTPVAANPNIAVTNALTNYTCDCGSPSNFNTMMGRAAGQRRIAAAVVTIDADMIANGSVRVSFPAAVQDFVYTLTTATGAAHAIGTDTVAIDNGDILITLPGGGAPDLIATDVVRILAAI